MYLDRIRINLFSTIGVWYMKAGLSMYCNNLQHINGGLLKWSIPESIFVLGFSIPSSCGSPIFFVESDDKAVDFGSIDPFQTHGLEKGIDYV